MSKSDEELRDACDAIQGDMANHQRMFNGEVTSTANARLAIETFEKLEQQWNDEDRNPYHRAPPTSETPQKPIERTETTATVDDRTYRIVREADDTKFRKASPQERWFMDHAMPRIALLMEKRELGSHGLGFLPVLNNPIVVNGEIVGGEVGSSNVPYSAISWAARVEAAASWKAAAKAFPDMFVKELVLLLEDSNHHFGDWKADAPKLVMVGG